MSKHKEKQAEQKQAFMIGDKVAAFGVITSVYRSSSTGTIIYTVTFDEYRSEVLTEDKLHLVEDRA